MIRFGKFNPNMAKSISKSPEMRWKHTQVEREIMISSGGQGGWPIIFDKAAAAEERAGEAKQGEKSS